MPDTPVPPDSSVKVTVKPAIEPDLINVKVSNPVTYLRLWWKKVMSKEGIDFRFRIHPVTAILIAVIIALGGFGAGRLNASVFSYIPILNKIITVPTSTPVPASSPSSGDWVDSAISGKLQITPNTNKYYLLTSSYIAVTLQFNQSLDLTKYLGKRILASGNYNQKTHTMIISDVLDLEVLPTNPVPVATIAPTPLSTTPPAINL